MSQDIFVGDRDEAAIEACIESPINYRWVFGRFRLWLRGDSVGDWNDTVTLKGVTAWWRDFVDKPRDRWDPCLRTQDGESLFGLLVSSVFEEPQWAAATPAGIEDAYSRFHISHLGMSAFDNYHVILIEPPSSEQRIVWRHKDGKVLDASLPPNKLQEIGRQFVETMVERVPVVAAESPRSLES